MHIGAPHILTQLIVGEFIGVSIQLFRSIKDVVICAGEVTSKYDYPVIHYCGNVEAPLLYMHTLCMCVEYKKRLYIATYNVVLNNSCGNIATVEVNTYN